MKTPNPSKEQLFLFNLLKGEQATGLDGLDAEALYGLFRRHRLFPMASSILPLLNEGERQRWQQTIRQGSIRSLQLLTRLIEISGELERAGIETRPLKGPVLAHSLYGDIAQRHMRDLDLLVDQKDVMRALEVLRGMGYALKYPAKELSARQWRRYFTQQYDVLLVHRKDGSILELHTRLAYPALLGGLEHLITQEYEHVDLSGRQFKSLSKEGSFLYLAIHGAHHLFFRLFWLRDLSSALNRRELDHERIADRAKQMGVERMLGVGLMLSEHYFGTRIPDAYQELLHANDRKLQKLLVRCHHAICTPRFYGKRSRINVFLFYMHMKGGWRHKWHTLSSVFHRWKLRRMAG